MHEEMKRKCTKNELLGNTIHLDLLIFSRIISVFQCLIFFLFMCSLSINHTHKEMNENALILITQLLNSSGLVYFFNVSYYPGISFLFIWVFSIY